MDYNFAVDSEKIDTLIEYINGKITAIETMRDNLLDNGTYPVNTLDTAGIWKGTVYEAFRDGAENGGAKVKESLDNCITQLKNYVAILTAAKTSSSKIFEGIS